MAKRRNLKNIEIEEVSLVDMPANKLPFLFFKRKGDGNNSMEKQKKKIKIEIESDGTVGGTSVTINGDKLDKLRSFDFSFYGGDPKQKIHASYSKETSSEDGFSRTETYYLSKGEIMDKKTLKALQAYLGEDIDFEKKVSEEDIEKALSLIAKEYKESFPEDLENAVGIIAKCAASRCEVGDSKEDVSKAGAKFSKDALKKLKAVIEAIEALKSILPEGESTKKSDSDGVTDELTKQITQLSEAVAKLDVEKKDDEAPGVTELTKLTKALHGISERLKTIEDGGVTRKSLTGDDSDDENEPAGAGKDGGPLWPTITGQK